jgi:pimeloyl-ACP methyl ester carboxylesterase
MRHETAHLLGGPVHYVDYGGQGPALLLIHGLGGSTLNWLDVAPRLAARNRVLAIDLVGFGHTPAAARKSDLETNRALIDAFLREVVGEPAVLVGNSMGGLLSMLEALAAPDRVRALVLVNPAIPKPLGLRIDRIAGAFVASFALPRLGERWLRRRAARLGPEGTVREVLAMVDLPESKMSQKSFDAHVELVKQRASMPWAERSLVQAARSLLVFLARPKQLYGVLDDIRAPVLLIHGHKDRLVPLTAAHAMHKARPEWTFRDLEDIGHVPMLEVPDEFVTIVQSWLDEHVQEAREKAG